MPRDAKVRPLRLLWPENVAHMAHGQVQRLSLIIEIFKSLFVRHKTDERKDNYGVQPVLGAPASRSCLRSTLPRRVGITSSFFSG